MNDEFIDCIKQLKPAHQKDAIKNKKDMMCLEKYLSMLLFGLALIFQILLNELWI